MIELPESLVLRRNIIAEKLLTDKARKWIEKDERTPGLHASDLLDPRLAYWQRKIPKPIPDRLVTTFLVGKVLHAFVLDGAVQGGAGALGADDVGSLISETLGISYSPDSLAGGKVRELKTTRSFYEPKSVEDLRLYLEQILVYMAATDPPTCSAQLWLLMLNLRDENKKTSPAFRTYDVEVPEADMKRVVERLQATRASLQLALDTDTPGTLPLCRQFKCGEGNCQWWNDCRPEGRWKG